MSDLCRIMKHTKGELVWYTAERRFLWFFWRSCFEDMYGDTSAYGTAESARRAIERFRKSSGKTTKELILKL